MGNLFLSKEIAQKPIPATAIDALIGECLRLRHNTFAMVQQEPLKNLYQKCMEGYQGKGDPSVVVGADMEVYRDQDPWPGPVWPLVRFRLKGVKWRPYTPVNEELLVAANHQRVEAITFRMTEANEALLKPLEEYLTAYGIPHQIRRNLGDSEEVPEDSLWKLIGETIQ